jgi:hypothetical protein
MTEDTTTLDHYSSVVWKVNKSSTLLPVVTHVHIAGNTMLQTYLQVFAQANLKVKEKMGVYFEDACMVQNSVHLLL